MSFKRFKVKTGKDKEISDLFIGYEKKCGISVEQIYSNRNEINNTVSLGIKGPSGILEDISEWIKHADFFVEEELVIGL